MKTFIQKTVTILLLTVVMTVQTVAPALALEAPTAPTAPENTNTAPSAPENTHVAPSAPSAPTQEEAAQERTAEEQQRAEEEAQEDAEEAADTTPGAENTSNASSPAGTNSNSGTSGSAQVGDNEIKTGDATNAANIQTGANNNLSAGTSGSSAGSATVANTGNGSNSSNNGSLSLADTNTTDQSNSAAVNNNLNQATTTGTNTSSDNVGNSSITTGDANTTGTVITAVNTNVNGVAVAEFNVEDDHRGDIVLDFGANCIVGCGIGSTAVKNSGNGSNSTNNASVDGSTNNSTFQNNDAIIGNDLVLSANSGDNEASRNTGGDSNITTGDANVAANVLTFANNNIAGNVVYGVVNIFGDLIGDIIFPEDQMNACCGTGSATATNTGNGSNSTNEASVNQSSTDETFQFNNADITNNLVFDATTGGNGTNANTGGSSEIGTGDSTVDANVFNIANTNIDGGNWYLVLVNEAGNWIGKIMGAPEGQNFGGSSGTDFNVDENGVITATNNGNGSNSTNDASVNQSTNNTTVQNNDAQIANNLNLSANTGGNTASDNTGGDSNIKTGDANIVANLVNFVNNNITGNGKLFVTVVNVFGSWMGDFVSPGHKKEDKPQVQSTTHQASTTNAQSAVGGATIEQKDGADTSKGVKATGKIALNSSFEDKNNDALGSRSTGATRDTSLQAVAGASDEDGDTVILAGKSGKKVQSLVYDASAQKMKINLAFVILAIPLVLLGFGVRKFVLARIIQRSAA